MYWCAVAVLSDRLHLLVTFFAESFDSGFDVDDDGSLSVTLRTLERNYSQGWHDGFILLSLIHPVV